AVGHRQRQRAGTLALARDELAAWRLAGGRRCLCRLQAHVWAAGGGAVFFAARVLAGTAVCARQVDLEEVSRGSGLLLAAEHPRPGFTTAAGALVAHPRREGGCLAHHECAGCAALASAQGGQILPLEVEK